MNEMNELNGELRGINGGNDRYAWMYRGIRLINMNELMN